VPDNGVGQMNRAPTICSGLVTAALSVMSPAFGQTLPADAPLIRSPEFCRALRSITDGSQHPFGGAILPGFTAPPQTSPGQAFHSEAVFIQGRSFDLVPQRVAQCASGGRWVMPLHPDTIRGQQAYRGVWGLPNLSNVSMVLIYYPDTNSTLVAMSFAIRQPDSDPQAGGKLPPQAMTEPTPSTWSSATKYHCADGRDFTTEYGGDDMRLRFKGNPDAVILHNLNEPHSPYGNATMRFDLGFAGEVEDGLSEVRNEKIVKRTDCYLIDSAGHQLKRKDSHY
jgi:hypothetical protein